MFLISDQVSAARGTHFKRPEGYGGIKIVTAGVTVDMMPEKSHSHTGQPNVKVEESLVEGMSDGRRGLNQDGEHRHHPL